MQDLITGPVYLVWFVKCPKSGQRLRMDRVRCGSVEDAKRYMQSVFCEPHPAWIESVSGDEVVTFNMGVDYFKTQETKEEVFVA